MTLVRVQGAKAAVPTLRSSARHTQARILVSGYYQGSYICPSWMNSSDLHLVSSTSIPVGSSTPLHIIVLHHLSRPPPGPAQAESSPLLPNDISLLNYGLAVEVSIRIFYFEKSRSWWRILSFRPNRILSYAWGWIILSMPTSRLTSTSTPTPTT
jgi:hypothetical protein